MRGRGGDAPRSEARALPGSTYRVVLADAGPYHPGMRVAVIGHVEWIEFVRVPRVPAAGDIVHASESWEEPGGGGAVAAVQLARLADECTFFTALGDDALGHRARDELAALGLRVEASSRPARQRRAFTHIDAAGERTITVIGERMAPLAADPLAWDRLSACDAVYVTACDEATLHRARRARTLVATSRIVPLLRAAGVALDAIVGSANDPAERYAAGDIAPPPRLVVRTAGGSGGTYEREGASFAYPASPLPGPVVDAYGGGDAFAAGLTFALATGRPPDAAVRLAAHYGAAVLTGRGPYAGQLRRADL